MRTNRYRIALALGALATLAAIEIAAVCGALAFAIEIVFGIDLPLVNWIA
jgi:hypothetical protein